MKKTIILIAVVLTIAGLSACFGSKGPSGPVELSFYGLDNSDVFDSLISKYKESHSNVTIKYKKFNDPAEFENLLINEIAEGEGPDVFYVHNTWLPRHTKKLVPLQSESLTPQTFSEVFVNVAADDFIQPNPADGEKKIYALPLYVDTLGLYYNKKDFEQKLPQRGKPADNWESFKAEADKLREQGDDGKLKHGVIALGRADNIRLASDILYNFFLQAGVEFYDSAFKQAQFANNGQETFNHFLSFSNPQQKNFSWSTDLVSADKPLGEVEAFLAGRVSAILGYSDLYQRLENDLKNVKTRNPSVVEVADIGVMPVPQIAVDSSDYKVWANYYGLAVSRNAKSPKAAWDFVQFLASKESLKTYHQKTKRPTSRRDLIEEQKKEPVTDVFVSQVGYAGSYRIFSDQKFDGILKEAVQAANNGQTPKEALNQAQSKMNAILKTEAPEGLYPKPKKK